MKMRKMNPGFFSKVLMWCVFFVVGGLCSGASVRERAAVILGASGNSGGLIVHLESGSGELTAELGRSGQFLVRGLDTDSEEIRASREYLMEEGLYGRTSVAEWAGRRIPMMDNSVNILVSEEDLPALPRSEILRVLAPLGTAFLGDERIEKPWPDAIDQWTHFLHGPDNNAVARDRVVGPPDRLQWIADPIHLRSHEHLNSISAVVSAEGRIIYIIDEGATAAVIGPPDWKLVARDAFNGCLLWKQKIGLWEGHFRLFRSGPAGIARRLVAVGGTVYVTEGYNKRVVAFDAATGKPLRDFPGTDGALELLCHEGVLYVMTGNMDLDPPSDPAKRYYPPPEADARGIVAVKAGTGEILWTRRDKSTATILPTAMAVSSGKLFFQSTGSLVCLDSRTGETEWQSENPVYTKRLAWSAPVLVASGGMVLVADGSTGGLKDVPRGGDRIEWILSDRDIRRHPVGTIRAFSAEDGREIWNGTSVQGFCNPGDIFVIDGRVWAGADVSPRQAMLDKVVDLRTGAVLSRRPKNGMPVGGHTRCYRNKATERYLVLGDIGVEFVDVDNWNWNANPWVRGTCQYGILPCNGLLYSPSDSCACRPEMRLHGFTAMAPRVPESAARPADSTSERLRRGPAYPRRKAEREISGDDAFWPTYRGDIARSGRTGVSVSTELKRGWRTEIGGELSSLTAGGGWVFVSRRDTHTVYALDEQSGDIVWSRIVGGEVDSPPTYSDGHVLFGCHDGCVYCLDAADGELVWRFRVASENRFIVAMENVESVWPVNGSVLVRDNLVWFSAGRGSFLDGGVCVFALNASTGDVEVRKKVFARGPQNFNAKRGRPGPEVTPPGVSDVLSANDTLVYMRTLAFDRAGGIVKTRPHLFSATGFLDDTWWHRTYWQYGTFMSGGFGGWPRAARQVPAGRIMSIGDDDLYAFGRTSYDSGNGGDVHAGHIGTVKENYQDMGLLKAESNPYRLYSAKKSHEAAGRGKRGKSQIQYNWSISVPLLVRAMVLADKRLLVAGPRAESDHGSLLSLGKPGPGLMQAISTADGGKIFEYVLESAPVFDGMAVVPGRVLISGIDGSVSCLH